MPKYKVNEGSTVTTPDGVQYTAGEVFEAQPEFLAELPNNSVVETEEAVTVKAVDEV